MALPNPFGDTNTGIIGKLNSAVGLKAAAPVSAPVSNSLPPNMSTPTGPAYAPPPSNLAPKTSSSNQSNAQTLALQHQLNTQNAGQPGWVALKEDGILGPKTQAAQSFKPTPVATNTNTSGTASTGNITGNTTPTSTQTSGTTLPDLANKNYTPDTGYGTYVSDLGNQAKNPTNSANGAIGGLIQNAQTNYGNSGQAYTDYQSAVKNLADFKQSLANADKNIAGQGISLSSSRGQEANINQAAASQIDALQQAVNQAQGALGYQLTGNQQQQSALSSAGSLSQTGQGLTQSALSGAAGALAPQMQFGQLTNPITGQPVNGGLYGQNPQLQTAVSQAVNLVQNGADVNSPQVQGLLSTFGLPGISLFTQAMQQSTNGTYNPTAESAIASQNASQGQQYQGQATQLNVALKSLDNITPVVTDFLNKTGLNSKGSPLANQQIKTYISNLQNPAAAASLNAMMGDIKTYTAQILGNSGLNPTEVSATVNSFDPALLNGNQLTSFLQNLKVLGNARLEPLQNASSGSYNGSSGYTGNNANTNYSTTTVPNNQTTLGTNPNAQVVGGGILNVANGAWNTIKGLAQHVLFTQ